MCIALIAAGTRGNNKLVQTACSSSRWQGEQLQLGLQSPGESYDF